MHSVVDVPFLPFLHISILNSYLRDLLPPPVNSHLQLMLCLLFSVEFRTSLLTHIKNGFMHVRLLQFRCNFGAYDHTAGPHQRSLPFRQAAYSLIYAQC